MTLGARLREERERLIPPMSQAAFAAACGQTRRSQILYEKDQAIPGGAYLIAADALGVDVLYVLTGKRAAPVALNTACASNSSVAVAGTHNAITISAPLSRRKMK